MNRASLDRLTAAVQANAHIADARHATDLALCSYLLQMRELYRWERGLPFGAALDRAAVGAWIAEREALWDAVAERDFEPLPIGDDCLDPFDTAAIDARLRPLGLVYDAGLLGAGRPAFFLAERHADAEREGLPVRVAGRELARGLIAPVATLFDDGRAPAIVVRRESLARWGWEKFEVFSLRRPEGSAFHAVVQAYALDRDFAAALPRWLDEQGEAAVLHEIGEWRAGQRLGPAWAAMRAALPTRRGELFARALRDHLADFEVTLPTLLARDARPSIHVWFANLDGVRELLAPTLKTAYAAWRGGDGGQALHAALARGRRHFTQLAEAALALHARDGAAAGAAIESLLQAPAAVLPA